MVRNLCSGLKWVPNTFTSTGSSYILQGRRQRHADQIKSCRLRPQVEPQILEDTYPDQSLEDSHEAELPAGSELSESPQVCRGAGVRSGYICCLIRDFWTSYHHA